MTEKNLHDGHRGRLREKVKQADIESLSAHEILELLLFYSVPRRNMNTEAHLIFDKYGSLSSVFNADVKDLMKIAGIGEHSALLIALIGKIQRLLELEKLHEKPKRILGNSESAGFYIKMMFQGFKKEVFYLICLDSKNRLIAHEKLYEGSINEIKIYPRDVVESALRHNAYSVMIAHNHPSGSLAPSGADLDVTRIIKKALETIGIKLVDHIIVGGNAYASFQEMGLMDSTR